MPKKQEFPKQATPKAEMESQMTPHPVDEDDQYRGSGKLTDKVALITGGDSGIGRAAAIAFAKEGADVAIVFLKNKKDADMTGQRVEAFGRRCLKIAGDVGQAAFAEKAVKQVIKGFGRLDILVNNAAEQHITRGLEEISEEDLESTFRTNIFGYFFMTKAALPHLKEGATIINTTSVQGYDPSPKLMDYASTKAAILNFTRSLAKQLAERGIRVNGVAPGPVWTPLITATFPQDQIQKFGTDTPMQRAAQPAELAPTYVYLASNIDSSYVTGQILHVNGGRAMVS